VYIVWDEKNWAGVGKLSPTPFGRFYSIDVVDGQAHEFDHRGIDFNLPHRVRVRLASDHVAFQYELDGKWIDLRKIERPKQFAGAPRIVAAGKYYGAQDKPFATEVAAAAAAAAPSEEKHSGAIERSAR
jgi:hypothetical protein